MDLVLHTVYAETNRHLFPSPSSFRWHLRFHRLEYIKAGAVLRVADRDYVDPVKFEKVFRRIALRTAKQAELVRTSKRGLEQEVAGA
jgi:hypothetical protein